MAVLLRDTPRRNAYVQAPVQRDWPRIVRRSATLLAVCALAAGMVYLHQPDTLPVKRVTVEGDLRHVDRSALITAVSPHVRGSFLDVDVARIRAAGESLPWVRQVRVRRVWPDTLHLIVEEQQAIARWNEDGLVNRRGSVFMPPAETLPAGLVQLTGPDGTSELMARRLAEIQRMLAPLDLRVVALRMDERRSWELDFADGMQLKLGRAAGEQRLQRFMAVFNGGLARYLPLIQEVDMRYTNGLAVVWKSGEQPDFNGTV